MIAGGRGRLFDHGLRKITFAETPPLPSYLVAFVAGPFEVVDALRPEDVHSAGARSRLLPEGRRGPGHRTRAGNCHVISNVTHPRSGSHDFCIHVPSNPAMV